MSDWYILNDNNEAVKVPMLEAANWKDENLDRCKVGETWLPSGLRVSTVFLGLDHALTGRHPEIFETMIFKDNSWSEVYCTRCATWSEAEAQHKAAVAWATMARKNDNNEWDIP